MITTAGELRHRITLQRDAGTADAAGEVAPSWTAYASNVPAKFEALGGGETDRAEQRTATAAARFTIRYQSVSPLDRIVWGSRTFSISRAADPDGRQVWLEIDAVEVP